MSYPREQIRQAVTTEKIVCAAVSAKPYKNHGNIEDVLKYVARKVNVQPPVAKTGCQSV